ncbi:MAG: phytanoyl-CoA dioxygenase family protein, partial [Caldilineaceae bacterium SB0661_bin_32]|nr:phytanoyl-CoA dioxygenase family protein [Caldilineaceae bacterium SB0661_bin_32]
MTAKLDGQLWQDQPQQALEAYIRDGYLALSGFLTPDQVVETRESVARFISDRVPQLPREQVFYETLGQPDTLKQIIGLFNHDTYFHRLMFGSRFEKLAELLLQGPVVGKNMQYFNKPPQIGKATPPHQD